MKKLLGSVVISLLLSSNAYAEIIGTDKSVNDYITGEGEYTIISTDVIDNVNILFNLRSNGRIKPLLVSCIYSPKEQITICFKP